MVPRSRILQATLLILIVATAAAAAPPREREPNSVYAERRARLRAQVDGPVVIFGYTGRESSSPSYVFNQEENFYYLTGHNEPGAAVVIIPEPPPTANKSVNGAREILFLAPRDRNRERWDGPRLGPADADVLERTGFAMVKPFAELRAELERLGKIFSSVHTLVPRDSEAGYPHTRTWQNWLYQVLPQATFRDVRGALGAMRQIKSATELKILERAIALSVDAHLEAMKMMRAGIHEYEVAAHMEYVHKGGGCEGEAYAPIVGAGFNSTVLHYNQVSKRIEPGEVVVLDVGCQFSGYAADITRTLPADGKFTARQREIYDIVYGAQEAMLAALKPGVVPGRGSEKSLFRIAYDYINTHGQDGEGKPLGKYLIHGIGHHIGLDVHDAGDPNRPLEPGMVITIEPGIYLPEENLGVRIEDIVLITADGYKLLTARLPRSAAEVEKFMAEARKKVTSE